MVFVAALANVVQQKRQIQHFAIYALFQDRAGDGQVFFEMAEFNLAEVPDALDGVFVHRVVMVHVELHHRDDGFKFRDKSGQNTKFVHPPQGAFRVAVFEHQVDKDALRLFRFAHVLVDQVKVGADEPHRIGMDQQTGAQRLFEDAQHVHLVGQKGRFVGNGQAVVYYFVAIFDLGRAFDQAQQERWFFLLGCLKRGQEDTGQVTDGCGVAEEILHEPFDSAASAFVDIFHAAGDLDLHVKGQLLGRAIGGEVQMAAHGPEECLGFDKGLVFLGSEDASADQFFDVVGVVNVLCDPEKRLKVS